MDRVGVAHTRVFGGDLETFTVFDIATRDVEPGWDRALGTTGWDISFTPTRMAFAHNGGIWLSIFDLETKEVEEGWPGNHVDAFGAPLPGYTEDDLIDATPFKLEWFDNYSKLAMMYTGGDIPSLLQVINASTKEIEDDWEPVVGGTGQMMSVADGRIAIAHYNMSIIDTATKTIETGWPLTTGQGTWGVWVSLLSPDGELLAVVYENSSGQSELAIIDTATKTIESGWPTLVDVPISGGSVGTWSRDGRYLFLFTDSHEGTVYKVIDRETKSISTGWPIWTVSLLGGAANENLFFGGGSRTAGPLVIDLNAKLVDPGWPSEFAGFVRGVAFSVEALELGIPSLRLLQRDDDNDLGHPRIAREQVTSEQKSIRRGPGTYF